MQRDIKQTWILKHSPEKVWEFLTSSELLSQWLMENNFRAEVGYKFQFKAKPRPGFDGNVYCEVLELQPNKRLTYSWKGGPGKGKIILDSVVSWTLIPRDYGTELQLEHSGFKGFRNYLAYIGLSKGWGSKIKERFTSLLNGCRHEAAKA